MANADTRPWIEAELEATELGDKRRSARLSRVMTRLALSPASSFPELFPEKNELDAFYGFIGNDDVSWEDILEPHLRATLRRVAGETVIRIPHDTTDFVFSGKREGLKPVMKDTNGFFFHAAIAVSGNETPVCLGTLAAMPYTRERSRGTKSKNEWKLEARQRPRAEKESSRWERQVLEVQSQLPADVHAVHVLDQETDDYVFYAELLAAGVNFVVRGSSARQVNGKKGNPLQAELEKFEGETFREIWVNERTPAQVKSKKNSKVHPVRKERKATLQIRWGELVLKKPQHAQTTVPEVRLGVVQVFEPNPPLGEQPIEWTLFTSEPLQSAEQACAVVDHYRCRWIIEEYFKAVKTGCAYQERQLTTLDGLLKALVMFLPIAWQLLALRTLARQETPPPASVMFRPEQLVLLAQLYKDRCSKTLVVEPTTRDALLAIARLGGHLPNNGDPGWITLRRGFDRFLEAERVQRLLFPPKECPVS
jgi:Transposase DNA-binding/Transposase DDE domain